MSYRIIQPYDLSMLCSTLPNQRTPPPPFTPHTDKVGLVKCTCPYKVQAQSACKQSKQSKHNPPAGRCAPGIIPHRAPNSPSTRD